MPNIKVLDCTLRDGGYINEWDFGKNKIKSIISLLDRANIEFIETGFLTKEPAGETKTLFNSFSDIEAHIEKNINTDKLFAMITYGKFPIEYVPNADETFIKGLRLIFKKQEKDSALDYCRKLKNKGFKLFINPTFTDQYTDIELIELINEINEIHPYGMAIVDSMGVLKEKDLLRLYYLIDNNLKKDIALCFHSHNNLQLSFSGAQCLMKVCHNRELIIDSTVFGMGRGAGNLCTELLTQYINDNYNGHYDIVPVLKIVDEEINSIFAKTPWGYSVPYYLAATNHCHPNYAKYLVDKQTVAVEVINEILKLIPADKRATYDEKYIKELYLNKVAKSVDDRRVIEIISQKLSNKKILLLAPGKSLNIEEEKIRKFIKQENPYIISLNFEPVMYKTDMTFVANAKRYSELPQKMYSKLVVTSNISPKDTDTLVINYSSYLSQSELFDNAALVFLNFLIKLGINSIYLAGLDGYSSNPSINYADDNLVHYVNYNSYEEYNELMNQELIKISKKISLNFLTKSKYSVTKN